LSAQRARFFEIGQAHEYQYQCPHNANPVTGQFLILADGLWFGLLFRMARKLGWKSSRNFVIRHPMGCV